MYDRYEQNSIVLSSFCELSYKQRSELTEGMSSEEPKFEECAGNLIKTLGEGVYNKIRDKFNSEKYRESVFTELEEKGITCIAYNSPDYPKSLKEISCPPFMLFAKGNASLLKERMFAVVGSRRTLPDALRRCEEFSEQLSERFAVVTGAADGADAAAIKGALKNGRVISVLAYGFDYVYPAINSSLIKSVAQNGLLLSEHYPHVEPKSYLFPVRNRIIAALGEGLLVASAGKKSGALITAGYAAEYGKDVFAFPYNPGINSGEGCNSLIKKGAALADNILDIYSAFGLDLKPQKENRLSEEERNTLSVLAESGDAPISEIAQKLGKPVYAVLPTLSSLEIKGMAVRLGGNRYAAVK